MTTEFNPNNSKVNPEKFAEFLDRELTGDLTEVPGIGPATVEILKNINVTYDNNGRVVNINGITSTYSLIGIYLSFKSECDSKTGEIRNVGSVEHAQRFFMWWCSLGTPAGFRAGVVNCICEKVNISFPGIFNSADYN